MADDRRNGPRERRHMVRRDEDACALCEHYREQDKEREAENQREHDAMWRVLEQHKTCAAADIKSKADENDVTEVKKEMSGKVPWPTFTVILVLLSAFLGWIADDHITLGRTVSTNSAVLKVFAENQTKMLEHWNITPTPFPKEIKK